ncbi:MAG TPA: hypothetical protein VG713_07380 [Pirellulales bacterium]|nr:hypothetical protein [Pirellulales bacterium]
MTAPCSRCCRIAECAAVARKLTPWSSGQLGGFCSQQNRVFVDGVVIEGHGSLDVQYLTGKPYRAPKAAGADVLIGSMNGPSVLIIRSTRLVINSFYARMM